MPTPNLLIGRGHSGDVRVYEATGVGDGYREVTAERWIEIQREAGYPPGAMIECVIPIPPANSPEPA